MSTSPYTQSCHKFSLADIKSATQNFNDALVVGKGGFGKVYKATITVDNGEPFTVAIKRLNLDSSQGATEFWAEIEMLTKLRHCNLVSLIGYCNEKSEMILIYEFMPHGTLDDHLHKMGTSLSWVQRLKISIGAARGLHYLHTGTGTQHGVIHRDVKSTNILLDEDYAAKISDFGLAKIGPTNTSGAYVKTDVRGTFGYLDPEYFLTGRLTRKSDVFAFGVVLFELLCGRVAVDNRLDDDESSLVKWARESIKKGKVPNIIDLKIKNQISPKCLKEFVQIANGCLSSESENRPEMEGIVVALQRCLSLQNKFDTTVKPTVGISSFGRMIKWPFNSGQSERQLSTTEDSVDHGSSSKEDRSTNIADKVKSATITPSPRSQYEILQSTNLKSFSFHVLKAATRNFCPDSVLGEGGFGVVYKGWIDEQSLTAAKPGTGTVIAIKRLNQDGPQGHREWLTEINYLGRLYHPNLVRLIGYCLEDDERLLVYEYMNRASLENHIFNRGSYSQTLPWNLRLKVALGAAKGLAYLHCPEVNVIYRDFKSSHILIDWEYNAKLCDFGFAKDGPLDGKSHISTSVMGTHGYAAPEYIATGHLTKQSDIYSFGVVLLEILTGRRSIDKNLTSDEQVLVDFAKPYLTNKIRILHIMDQAIAGQYPSKVAIRAADLAMKCISSEPKSRPIADELVKVLEQLQEMQEGWEKENRRKETDEVKFATITPSPRSQDEILLSTNLKSFSFHVLKAATRNFRPKAVVGVGGFDSVYKAYIDEQSLIAAKPGTGTVVAVKRCENLREWLTEINYLGRLYHPNLVQLIGYCLEDNQRLLVYEYLNCGSLEKYIFRRQHPLRWNLRLKVVLGAARGLAYLHCPEVNVIYRDFKSSCILIDSGYNAKLSDFGLAKDGPLDGKSHVSTRVMGTHGYAAPEYIATGHLSKRSDIYSFGVVLLEILTGRRCFDHDSKQWLVDFAEHYLTSKRSILKIMDRRIAGQYSSKVAIRAADLAMRCISSEPKSRPTADELVKVLEQLQEMQEVGVFNESNNEFSNYSNGISRIFYIFT